MRISLKAALLSAVAVVVLGAAGIGVALATDSPAFCNSCHEMKPFHEAWSGGAHAGTPCISCHVEPGIPARLSHKLVALRQLREHVLGDPKFPLATEVEVPDERCVACHTSIETSTTGFSHAEHAKKGRCYQCHFEAGHEVASSALASAGVLDPTAERARLAGKVASVGGGRANVADHARVVCDSCHIMRATACQGCHTPKHAKAKSLGDVSCSACHAPGAKWAFAHPTAGTCSTCHARPAKHKTGECSSCHPKRGVDWAFAHPAGGTCSSCHARPAKHKTGECSACHPRRGVSWVYAHPSSGSCSNCHARPVRHKAGPCNACHPKRGVSWAYSHPTSGSCVSCHVRPAGHRTASCTTCHARGSWVFRHPGSGSTCTSCHTRPSGHKSGACSSCHKALGKSWAFSHPSGGSCTSCHTRPASHSGRACTSCHKPGSSWRFTHPGSGSDCTDCHARPSGHRSGACTSCHNVGSTWAFSHPSSTACASCHTAPSGHYGTSCASCHSPGRAWSSATFSHPSIRGGEHTYRSFACVNCHPSGYSSYSCLRCHDTATGPGDDD